MKRLELTILLSLMLGITVLVSCQKIEVLEDDALTNPFSPDSELEILIWDDCYQIEFQGTKRVILEWTPAYQYIENPSSVDKVIVYRDGLIRGQVNFDDFDFIDQQVSVGVTYTYELALRYDALISKKSIPCVITVE